MGIDQSVAQGLATLARIEQAQGGTGATPLAAGAAVAVAASANAAGGALAGLDDGLTALYFATSGQATAMSAYLDQSLTLGLAASALSADGRYVTVDVSVKAGGSAADLLAQLQVLGLQHGSSYAGLVSGDLPVDALGAVSAVSLVGQAHASVGESAAGTVQSQGVKAERVDLAQSAHSSITGTGLRLGILSDSFDTDTSASTHKAGDITSGDLPTDTVVLAEEPPNSSGQPQGEDEGRAMAQLAHDVAPGASIDFATAASGGQAGFANNIIALANHGDKVIVDDYTYFLELMYQNGPIAQAVENVVKNDGVTYFSSAANNSNHGWEGVWANGSSFTYNSNNYTDLAFAPGQDYLPVTIGRASTSVNFSLDWDEPGASAGGPGATSDLDIFLYSDAALTQLIGSVTTSQIGGDPANYFYITSGSAANTTYYIRVAYNTTLGGGAPPEVRLVADDNGRAITFGTTSTNLNPGAVYGHNVAGGSIGTAAAYYAQTPAYDATDYPAGALETYSSVGYDKQTYSDAGVRLATPVINTPQITGVDGVDTTFFGSNRDGTSPPNFSGTSAAAPDVAAVAVLLLQANPNLTSADVLALLQDSALDMDNPYTSGFDTGFDVASGAGLVQADLAVNFALGGIISNPSQTVLQGTHLADVLQGGALNDVITGGAGNDTIYGGMGRDTAVYSGPQSAYSVTRNADGSFTVADTRSGAPDGSDTLSSVEVLQFADGQRQLIPSASDFNADGTSDVVLQSGGTLVDWRIQGGAYQGGSTITTQAAGFSVVGKGDLNGDGTGDVVLQNAAGKVVAAILQNGVLQSNTVISAGGSGYKLVGVGDLNNDGTSDLVLQNGGTIVDWTIKNGAYQSGSVITNGATGYTVVGVGDFNGDGNNDLLVQNGGTILAAFLKNGVLQSSAVISSGAAGYKVVGVGDFDGDGTSDILLQNGDTVVDWIIKNGAYSTGHTLTTAAGGFTVVGVGDYNGDGTSDVLLQNAGTVVDWILGGGAYVTGHVITTGATGYTAG